MALRLYKELGSNGELNVSAWIFNTNRVGKELNIAHSYYVGYKKRALNCAKTNQKGLDGTTIMPSDAECIENLKQCLYELAKKNNRVYNGRN
jgi:hypothetical protein